MVEVFEEVFGEVMEELGLEGWYELFDSEEFELVEDRIEAMFGAEVFESEEYISWVHEMAWDL